jgi:hypothetical protein
VDQFMASQKNLDFGVGDLEKYVLIKLFEA